MSSIFKKLPGALALAIALFIVATGVTALLEPEALSQNYKANRDTATKHDTVIKRDTVYVYPRRVHSVMVKDGARYELVDDYCNADTIYGQDATVIVTYERVLIYDPVELRKNDKLKHK